MKYTAEELADVLRSIDEHSSHRGHHICMELWWEGREMPPEVRERYEREKAEWAASEPHSEPTEGQP